MNWYIVKLVFQIINKSTNQQFDEQLRLILAYDQNEAFEKAEAIGMLEQDQFLNVQSNMVFWKFEGVVSLNQIQSLDNGTELHSRIFEKKESESYLASIKLKHTKLSSQLVLVE